MAFSRFQRELRTAHWPRSLSELAAVGVTPKMLRSARWRRTWHGYYVPHHGDERVTATQRILDVAPIIPPAAAPTGWAAAYCHGVELLDGLDPNTMMPLPAEVVLGAGSGGRTNNAQVRYLRDRISADELVTLANVPLFDQSRKLLGIADLFDREAGLVSEFDGQDHRGRGQHRADNVREENSRRPG